MVYDFILLLHEILKWEAMRCPGICWLVRNMGKTRCLYKRQDGRKSPNSCCVNTLINSEIASPNYGKNWKVTRSCKNCCQGCKIVCLELYLICWTPSLINVYKVPIQWNLLYRQCYCPDILNRCVIVNEFILTLSSLHVDKDHQAILSSFASKE